MTSFVVHYQEIALKGKNRPWFLGRLVRNLQRALADLDVTGVRSLMGRIEVVLGPSANPRAVAERIGRTFGIAKNRPAVFRCGILWSDPAGGVVIGLTTGGRVAVITGSRIVPLNRPASVLAGNADAGTW